MGATAAAPSSQGSVAGKWQGQFDSQIGLQKYTYDFKVDGTNLTGTAIGITDNGTNTSAISEGKINLNSISFVEPFKFGDQDIRIEYTGKVSGDEIKLHRKVGDFAEEDLTVKRVRLAKPVVSPNKASATMRPNLQSRRMVRREHPAWPVLSNKT